MNRAEIITEKIGETPLIKMREASKKTGALVYGKLECRNPGASVKDRIAFSMIDAAEKEGLLKPDSVIIEPTSGNTGIGLAFICAAKHYSLILTMPESMSIERRKLLKAFGAQLVLTPAEEGMKGAIQKAEKLVRETPLGFNPQQFNNPANPEVHRQTTAVEIWNDTRGEVDIFIAGIGTGGTITGVSEVLKKRKPHLISVGVEPEESAVLSGNPAGPHKIQGIGAGFIPAVLNREIIDHIVTVNSLEAAQTARALAKEEGVLAGISSGAALKAVEKIARKIELAGKTVVVMLPDSGERYLSTWIFEEDDSV